MVRCYCRLSGGNITYKYYFMALLRIPYFCNFFSTHMKADIMLFMRYSLVQSQLYLHPIPLYGVAMLLVQAWHSSHAFRHLKQIRKPLCGSRRLTRTEKRCLTISVDSKYLIVNIDGIIIPCTLLFYLKRAVFSI